MKFILLIIAVLCLTQVAFAFNDDCEEKVAEVRREYNLVRGDERRRYQTNLVRRVASQNLRAPENTVRYFVFNILLDYSLDKDTVCDIYDNIFPRRVSYSQQKNTCINSVNDDRNRYDNIRTNEERRRFQSDVISRVARQYPNAFDNVVRYYVLNVLFDYSYEPRIVCILRDQLLVSGRKVTPIIKKKSECEQRILETRTKYFNLPASERPAFETRLIREVGQKHPRSPQNVVIYFVRGVLLDRSFEVGAACLAYEALFPVRKVKKISLKKDDDDCIRRILDVRAEYERLPQNLRVSYIRSLITQYRRRYPRVPENTVQYFVTEVLVQRSFEIRAACIVYDNLFDDDDKKVKKISSVKSNCVEEIERRRTEYFNLPASERPAYETRLIREVGQKHPTAPQNVVIYFVRAIVLDRSFEVRAACLAYEALFPVRKVKKIVSKQRKLDCDDKILAVRREYAALNVTERVRYTQNKINEYRRRYPRVAENIVRYFVSAILLNDSFDEDAACDVYENIFGRF